MRDGLSALQDAHDGGLAFEVAVLGHAHVRFFVLFLGLLELHLVDLHTVLGMLEVEIDRERIGIVDVPSLRMFGQWP